MVAASSNVRRSGLWAIATTRVRTRVANDAGAKPSTASPGSEGGDVAAARARSRPDNSMPMVAPAKPFSTASSESRPIAYITSRKFRPVATGSISTSSAASSRSGNGNHSRLRSEPGAPKPSTVCGAAACPGRARSSRSAALAAVIMRGTWRPVRGEQHFFFGVAREQFAGEQGSRGVRALRTHVDAGGIASSGCSLASTRPRPHSAACSGCSAAASAGRRFERRAAARDHPRVGCARHGARDGARGARAPAWCRFGRAAWPRHRRRPAAIAAR